MLVIAGYLVVLASVFGGFALSGGHLAALLQPVELLMIGGAGAGALFVGNTGKALHAIVRTLPSVLKGSSYAKAVFMELMALLYDILVKVRKEGLMTIEDDVENPAQSPLFAHYPLVLADSHMLEFVTDFDRAQHRQCQQRGLSPPKRRAEREHAAFHRQRIFRSRRESGNRRSRLQPVPGCAGHSIRIQVSLLLDLSHPVEPDR